MEFSHLKSLEKSVAKARSRSPARKLFQRRRARPPSLLFDRTRPNNTQDGWDCRWSLEGAPGRQAHARASPGAAQGGASPSLSVRAIIRGFRGFP